MGLITMVLVKLVVGYLILVVASKQSGLLKTFGYTIGIAIIVLALASGLICDSLRREGFEGKMFHKGYSSKTCSPGMLKACPMTK